MEKNEIKKELYREKPRAEIVNVKKGGILYSASIPGDQATADGRRKYMSVYFLVPLDDIGEATFLNELPAQLLIRYLIDEPAF